MAIFNLIGSNKNKYELRPCETMISKECAEDYFDLYLSEEFYKDENKKEQRGYRLHSRNMKGVWDYFAKDILCPKCGERMHAVGTAESFHKLALYACDNCNK